MRPVSFLDFSLSIEHLLSFLFDPSLEEQGIRMYETVHKLMRTLIRGIDYYWIQDFMSVLVLVIK